jgi:hypothetical protein
MNCVGGWKSLLAIFSYAGPIRERILNLAKGTCATIR